MILRYIYSACIVVETSDLRICCDPWFTQGVYDGAWYQYPEVVDPVGKIGPIDLIYVSHIHPDHYDPPYLRALLDANDGCQLVIGGENQSFLKAKMVRDGFDPLEVSNMKVGATEISIVPNYSDPDVNIDSALVVKEDDLVLVNMNDCPFDAEQIDRILDIAGKSPDVACLPYAGAGPFPQAYRFNDIESRALAASRKEQQFLELFDKYLSALNPRWAMPFAGLYYLGGSRRWMNSWRGVPDALEVVKKHGDRVIVLREADGSLNLRTGEIENRRIAPYDPQLRDASLARFDDVKYPYEYAERTTEDAIVSKLSVAHRSANTRITNKPSGWLCFKGQNTRFMCVHSDEPGNVELLDVVDGLEPREEIYIDERLLDGLLERKYHWNNAEIGSHFEFGRFPEQYDRRVYNLLNFLHV